MNKKIIGSGITLVAVSVASGIISFSATGSADAAAPQPFHAVIAGVNPGADRTNKAGYQQAQGLKVREKPDASAPNDLKLLGGGGCTLGYGGGRAACLPITPPAAGAMDMTVQEMPWTCNQVHTAGFPDGIPVTKRGVDPAHLDSNGDGIACGKGDK